MVQSPHIICQHGSTRFLGPVYDDQDFDVAARLITRGEGRKSHVEIRLIETRDNYEQTEIMRRFRCNLKWVQLAPFQIPVYDGAAPIYRDS